MKKVFTITLILTTAFVVFAQGISEIQHTSYENVVSLDSGISTNEIIKSSFDQDGNLEISYEGSESLSICITGNLNGSLIVKSDADITLSNC